MPDRGTLGVRATEAGSNPTSEPFAPPRRGFGSFINIENLGLNSYNNDYYMSRSTSALLRVFGLIIARFLSILAVFGLVGLSLNKISRGEDLSGLILLLLSTGTGLIVNKFWSKKEKEEMEMPFHSSLDDFGD